MIKRTILHTFFICISLYGIGQTNLDSLWNVWNNTKQHDTIRLKAIHRYAWDGYLFSQPDSAFYFAQLEYDFAKSKGLKKYMAKAQSAQ